MHFSQIQPPKCDPLGSTDSQQFSFEKSVIKFTTPSLECPDSQEELGSRTSTETEANAWKGTLPLPIVLRSGKRGDLNNGYEVWIVEPA